MVCFSSQTGEFCDVGFFSGLELLPGFGEFICHLSQLTTSLNSLGKHLRIPIIKETVCIACIRLHKITVVINSYLTVEDLLRLQHLDVLVEVQAGIAGHHLAIDSPA